MVGLKVCVCVIVGDAVGVGVGVVKMSVVIELVLNTVKKFIYPFMGVVKPLAASDPSRPIVRKLMSERKAPALALCATWVPAT